MLRLVGSNFGLVLQREANIVQAFEQAPTGEFIDWEASGEAVTVFDRAVL
jgi:hypothetical protein